MAFKRAGRDDDGQILLLTGILLALAFILFSVQLSLVASIGQQAGRESVNPLMEDYLLIRQVMHTTLQDELTNETGVVKCPTDVTLLRGRIQSLLVMVATHEQNRGHAFLGQLDSVTTTGPVEIRIDVTMTDGEATVRDSLRHIIPCTP